MINRGELTYPRSFRRLRLGLVLVTALLAVSAVAVSILAATYQQRIDEASRYNRTFDSSQALAELLRLQLAFARADSREALPELTLRTAILKNRASLLEKATFPNAEMRNEILPRLAEAVRTVEPLVDTIPNEESSDRAVAALQPLVQPLARTTSRTHAIAGDEVSRTQTQLQKLFMGLSALTLMLVLFGAALVTFVFRQNLRLDRTARTDALTGLANRREFGLQLDRIEVVKGCAIILIDVDHFKTLNDTNGHDIGDIALRQVALRLAKAAPDAKLVARIGGDEFAIIYEGAEAQQRSRSACERILDSMQHPVGQSEREMKVGVTLGLRTLEAMETDLTPDDLLKDADLALYEGKEAGRGQATEFVPKMKQAFVERHRLERDLRGAIGRGEHHLQFQPVVDLQTNKTLGFEALLRWAHPEFGMVPPSQFVPMAEESDLIHELGRWVLVEAIATARSWPGDIFVAVNLSARQLNDAGLVAFIASVLDDNGFPADRLEIEIMT